MRSCSAETRHRRAPPPHDPMGHRRRTRYRHVFSGYRTSPMPEPNRPPWRIASDLGNWAIWQLAERGAVIVIECDSCPHFVRWTPADLTSRFPRSLGRTMAWIAPKLRCSRCRSNWVKVSAEAKGSVSGRPEVWG